MTAAQQEDDEILPCRSFHLRIAEAEIIQAIAGVFETAEVAYHTLQGQAKYQGFAMKLCC